MEKFPQTRDDVDTMIKNRFFVDAFIDLKVPSEICAKRLYSQKFESLEKSSTPEENVLTELMNK